MSGLHPDARRIIEAPLQAGGRRLIGEALWLYLRLVAFANHRGVIIRRADRLIAEVELEEDVLTEWLERLKKAGLVEVFAPKPYLVVKLRFWSDKSLAEGQKTATRAAERVEVPVSSKAIAAIGKTGVKGGQGEGEELLRDILRVLGETDPEPFRGVLHSFSSEVIRTVLRRIEATPDSQIRKSKTALFRLLLTKLST